MRKILITGFAGFVGYSLLNRLREQYEITALDNFTNFSNYDIKLRRAAELGITNFAEFATKREAYENGVSFHLADVTDEDFLNQLFKNNRFDAVIHLAALTGVRPSLKHPQAYIDNNITGFKNILEAARTNNVKHIIYASSSSVYGANTTTPYSELQQTDKPISVYAASKKTNELFAELYSSLYGLNITGLRFFTVYGPWTRPDMAAYLFMKAIADETSIQLFDKGNLLRDFTYIDDVTNAIEMLLEKQLGTSESAHRIFNVGHHAPVKVSEFLATIEKHMGKKAIVTFSDMQPGDMPATYASVERLQQYLGIVPTTTTEEGIAKMVRWFKEYYY